MNYKKILLTAFILAICFFAFSKAEVTNAITYTSYGDCVTSCGNSYNYDSSGVTDCINDNCSSLLTTTATGTTDTTTKTTKTTGGLVPKTCGQSGTITYDSSGKCTSGTTCPCGICDFFQLLANIYSFIVVDVATPLAVVALIVGGVLMLISAGNPTTFGKGKEILKWAIIGLALVFGSYVIISFILSAIGYTESWSSLTLSCS